MNLEVHPLVVLFGVIMLVALGILVASKWTPEARTRRKRRRNYGKVIPRSKRPNVMLNVKPPKEPPNQE